MKISFTLPVRQLICFFAFVLLCFSPFYKSSVVAQDTLRLVSVAVPESLEAIFSSTILPRFLDENPDIYVSIIPIPAALYQDLTWPTSQKDLKKYLDATETLVSQADVLLIQPSTLSLEATRAGYFLDLKPLVAGDVQLPIDDFIPAAWQSYQWDGGYWALPARVTPIVLAYNPVAFDVNGLTYPTERWTLSDFVNAAHILSESDRPGLQVNTIDLPMFLRTFMEHGFIDESLPANPNLDTPELVALLEQWSVLEIEGVVTRNYLENAPLQLTRISALEDPMLVGGLLFGGQAGIDVSGIALSRGVNDVEAAYRLATYLTNAQEMQVVSPDAVPARYSVQQTSEDGPSLSAEAMHLRQEALEHGLPISEVVLGSYISQALNLIATGEAATTALQDAQMDAVFSLADAEAKRDEIVIVVPLRTPVPVSSPNEVSIQFGMFTGGTELPNRAEWERVIEEFLAADSTIDRIAFNFVSSTDDYFDAIRQNDCVYGFYADWFSNEELLALEPLIATDPTFEADDVVGNIMQDMQRNEQTFTLPVTIFPYVLRYNRGLFEAVGLPEPDYTWTVSEFVDTLKQLKSVTGDAPPLQLSLNSTTPWEMLMAGYGTPLIDYSISPATLNMSTPNIVSVTQQVLDLGKSKLISYAEIATYWGFSQTAQKDIPLVADYFSLDKLGNDPSQYGIVTFPVSDEATPVAYSTNSGFIFSTARYPEACYRWLREISRHPELYQGMPVFRSVIENDTMQAMFSENEIEIFKFFADMMDAPNSVFVRPSGLGPQANMLLGRAFDRYVFENGDLETELQQASEMIDIYRACVMAKQQSLECLVETDPTIRDLLPIPLRKDL